MARSLEPLGQEHDRSRFDCGSEPLNSFLKRVARQHAERGLSRTFVLIDDTGGKEIIGFFTLSATEADSAHLPPALARKLPRKIPAARLGRLAVSKTHQGQGLGSFLLVEALRKILHASSEMGIAGAFVDAKDDAAAKFYSRFGFLALPNQPLVLFLPIQTITKALAQTP